MCLFDVNLFVSFGSDVERDLDLFHFYVLNNSVTVINISNNFEKCSLECLGIFWRVFTLLTFLFLDPGGYYSLLRNFYNS